MGTDAYFDWSDKTALATLTKMHGEGASASEIAKALGGGVTRNAVIGKCHRLGFRRTEQAIQATARLTQVSRPSAPRKMTAAPKPSPRIGIAGNGATFEHAPAAPMPAICEVTSTGEPARIIDQNFGGCRWPIGIDPGSNRMDEQRFCCGAREPGQTYCTKHRALGFTKQGNPLGKKAANTNDMIRQLRRFV